MNPVIHLAIAAHKRREQQEEEQMSGYNASDLEGWEFKIVRSTMGRFGNSEVVKRVVDEEAQNGWEMLEKFDDYRIRFKRRIEKRALHSGGNIDPYRTSFGIGNAVGPLLGLVIALVVAGVLFLTRSNSNTNTAMTTSIVFGAIVVIALAMILIRKLGRS